MKMMLCRKAGTLIKNLVLICALVMTQYTLAQTNDQTPEIYDQLFQVNVNTASADVLAEMLDGVGISRAQAIVEYREANGNFTSVDDLKLVSGIGEVTIMNNRDKILFE